MSISAKLFASRKHTEKLFRGKHVANLGNPPITCGDPHHLTSEPLEPLLPPPPPQHQKSDEDHDDTHQHAGNGHHHLQTLTGPRVILAHIGRLH